MKKLTVCLLFCALAATTYAQSRLSLGGGYLKTEYSTHEYKSYNNDFNFSFSALYSFKDPASSWGLQTGIELFEHGLYGHAKIPVKGEYYPFDDRFFIAAGICYNINLSNVNTFEWNFDTMFELNYRIILGKQFALTPKVGYWYNFTGINYYDERLRLNSFVVSLHLEHF